MSKLGIKCKIYRNTATYGSPTWAEITLIGDASVSPVWDEAAGDVRGSRVKSVAKTLMGLEVSARVRVSNDDAGYEALNDALHSDTPLDLLVLNGPNNEEGVRGYRADWHVMQAPQDQALGAVLFDDLILKPAISANGVKAASVGSGGTLSYTAL